MKFLDYVEKRRSYYELDNQVDITKEELEELIAKALRVTPSPFNMQASKLVLLLDDEHRKFWNKVNATFDNKIDEAKFKGFHDAKGSILYFIDKSIVKGMQDQFPSYADHFTQWSAHENAMLQINLWVALRNEELGASLQHYNPVIDEWVKEDYDLDENLELVAQMPFGRILSEPEAKDKLPTEERLKIFG